MERNGEHVRIAVEGGLGAVAVVHVPVDGGDPFKPMNRARMLDADDGVAEQAEAHGEIGQRMVARRAAQHIGIVDLAREHGVEAFDGSACREQRNLVTALAHGGEGAGVAAAGIADGLDVVDMGLGVEPQNFDGLCRARLDGHEVVKQAADLDQVAEPPLGLGVFRMFARLNRQARLEQLVPVQRVVPHVEFVADPACFHAPLPSAGDKAWCAGVPDCGIIPPIVSKDSGLRNTPPGV